MKWLTRCRKKLEKAIDITRYRAEEICGSLQKQRKARKHAFRRTKSR